MPGPLACNVCGHPVVVSWNHDVPAAKTFPAMNCKCGKPARVRCFDGLATYWVECEEGHGAGQRRVVESVAGHAHRGAT
jgi:hypothetical protein